MGHPYILSLTANGARIVYIVLYVFCMAAIFPNYLSASKTVAYTYRGTVCHRICLQDDTLLYTACTSPSLQRDSTYISYMHTYRNIIKSLYFWEKSSSGKIITEKSVTNAQFTHTHIHTHDAHTRRTYIHARTHTHTHTPHLYISPCTHTYKLNFSNLCVCMCVCVVCVCLCVCSPHWLYYYISWLYYILV